MLSLFTWYKTLRSISTDTISTPKEEMFYWVTIMFSQTLGTALGDWTADTAGLGYGIGIIIFAALLLTVVVLNFWTSISKAVLFWAAFILTRPLGAVLGDFLDKPIAKGGLELSRYSASAVLIGFIILCLIVFPQRAGKSSGH